MIFAFVFFTVASFLNKSSGRWGQLNYIKKYMNVKRNIGVGAIFALHPFESRFGFLLCRNRFKKRRRQKHGRTTSEGNFKRPKGSFEGFERSAFTKNPGIYRGFWKKVKNFLKNKENCAKIKGGNGRSFTQKVTSILKGEKENMPLQESGEMYLESIYLLIKEKGFVRSVDVGEKMGYSKPSVSRAVGILKRGGYLLSDKEGYLVLTEKGRNIAEKTYERHTLLTSIFVSLGVPEEVAAADACKIEHYISDTTFQALKDTISNKKAHFERPE